jgi:adenine-specific DNA-methyltransferase
LSSIGHCYTGEIDLTQDKCYLSNDKRHSVLIKGAIIDRYQIRLSMSQGEILFLNSREYLAENHGERAHHHRLRRIVMQGITGVNEKIRLKMTLAEHGTFCANSVNYLVMIDAAAQPECFLALLNSSLLNFMFSKTSTNSNVNGYEVDNLPIVIPDSSLRNSLIALVERILGAKKRDHNADTTALDQEIDRLVYKLYGLSPEEIAIVEKSTRVK